MEPGETLSIKMRKNSKLSNQENKIKSFEATVSKHKKYPFWFNFVLIFIPVVFFVLLEVTLQIIKYGKDTSQWVESAPGYTMLNPDVAFRYFHSTAGIPYSNQNSFATIKGTNTFRVFIMGGSSAAGYPYTPNGDFGLYIKKKLEIIYPEWDIEVVNIALTATNSYTIRNLLPGVIEQSPDLILIYAGHNEYYGSLGVGSMESIGQSRAVVNFVLSLEKYKSFVLLRNFIGWVQGLFSNGGENDFPKHSGTLMSRMAKDQAIALNSQTFNLGIEQFEGNLNDILEICTQNKIPVILGTLASNLRDQKPFISLEDSVLPKAENIFDLAKTKLDNTQEALELFRKAKDLDGLRFRAPEEMNRVIIRTGLKFNYPVVNIDSIFNSASPFGIVGNELMTDHLHPTFDGYKLIGKSFFNIMDKNNFLPATGKIYIHNSSLDSLIELQTYISSLDSVIAKYRILVLKNDWPYSTPKSVAYMLKLFNQQTLIDSIAVKVLDNRYSWERAHREAAQHYYNTGNFEAFIKEMKILINQYPFVSEYYTFSCETLLDAKLYEASYIFLLKGRKNFSGAFYSKWLGIIDLSKEKTDSAIKYLNESLSFNNSDSQVLYNLSGAYSKMKMFNEALSSIERCLRINPNYPGAQNLKSQLILITERRQ